MGVSVGVPLSCGSCCKAEFEAKLITNTFELMFGTKLTTMLRAVFVASTSDVERTIGMIFSLQKW